MLGIASGGRDILLFALLFCFLDLLTTSLGVLGFEVWCLAWREEVEEEGLWSMYEFELLIIFSGRLV